MGPDGVSKTKFTSFKSQTFDGDDIDAIGHFGSAVGLGGLGSVEGLESIFGDLGSKLFDKKEDIEEPD